MSKETTEKENLDTVLANINKEYGKNSVIMLSDKIVGEYDVIPTGSIAFDYGALGIGGFAKGRIYEVRGWEGVGKSTICGHLAAECQKKGEKVLYMDGEYALDRDYFTALGVDVDKMLISQPDDGDVGFAIVQKLINTGEIDLVIIDSDSSFLPKSVLEGEVGASNIGKKAKLNSDIYPKLKKAVNRANCCLVVTSQYREKIGILFGDPKTTQGGKALGFYADCIIELTKSLIKDGDEVVANKVTMKTIKNKTFVPFKKAEANVVFGIGIDKVEEIIKLGGELEILKKWGKTITYEDNKYNVDEFSALIVDNVEFYNKLKGEIVSKINV